MKNRGEPREAQPKLQYSRGSPRVGSAPAAEIALAHLARHRFGCWDSVLGDDGAVDGREEVPRTPEHFVAGVGDEVELYGALCGFGHPYHATCGR